MKRIRWTNEKTGHLFKERTRAFEDRMRDEIYQAETNTERERKKKTEHQRIVRQ